MDHVDKPSIKMTKKQKDFTKVTFAPDFSRFGCDGIDVDHFASSQRVYDMAGTTKDVKVYLNGDSSGLSTSLYFTHPRGARGTSCRGGRESQILS